MISEIDRVDTIARLGGIPVPHTNAAVYAVSEDGRRWVAKREEDMGFEALLAEALSWQLGRALGVFLPDAAFCENGRTWLSALVPNVAHWDPRLAVRVSNPGQVGAMLVLDLWVHNEARHARNILSEALPDGSVRVWTIDADEALVSHIDDFAMRVGDAPSVHNHARGLPVAACRSGASEALDAVGALAPSDLGYAVEAACTIAREPRHVELTSLLQRHGEALPGLVSGYLDAVENLR